MKRKISKNWRKRSGYRFRDPDLLQNGRMTHKFLRRMKSGFRETHESNERLEFLGDAVLELAASEYLFLDKRGVSRKGS